MGRLLLLFILVPLAELVLLLEIGRRVGLFATLVLIVVTGALGAFLARRQGLGILERVRSELQRGSLPAGQLVDGVIVLLAGAVLMTPGVLTDLFGFFCLVPAGRRMVKKELKRRFQRAVETGSVRVSVDLGGAPFGRPERPVRDVTPRGEPPLRSDRAPAEIETVASNAGQKDGLD